MTNKISNGVKKLEGKIALITGASSGIGRAIAIKLAELGAMITVNYLSNEKGAKETVTEIEKLGGKALAIQADVASENEVKKMVSEIKKKMGNITLLVNNASADFSLETLQETPWSSFEKHLEVQVRGAYNVLQATLPGMKEEKYGKIVNILSAFILQGLPKKAASYTVAKEALWGFTKVAAADLAPYDIRVNAVSPELTDTTAAEKAFPPHYKEFAASKSPLGKINSPEDVAKKVAFLLLPESDNLTGANIVIGV